MSSLHRFHVILSATKDFQAPFHPCEEILWGLNVKMTSTLPAVAHTTETHNPDKCVFYVRPSCQGNQQHPALLVERDA